MKKILCLLLVLVFAMSVSAAALAAEKEIKIAFITQSLTNASQAFAWSQFQEYAPQYGYTPYLFEEDYDPQKGAAAITTCIAQGFAAISINPTDPSAMIPSFMEAQQAGVIVGMYSSEVPAGSEQYRTFMCGTNDVICGEVAAQTLMAAFPNGVKVVEVGGQSGHDAQIKRHNGFFDTIDKSIVTVLDSKNCPRWSSDDAMKIMEDFITLYGDEIQAVYCHWDIGATGCIEALKAANLLEGVYVIGVDGCSIGYDQVIEGTQQLCIGQNFTRMTTDTLDTIKKILNNEPYDEVTFTAVDVVTPENVHTFPYPKW